MVNTLDKATINFLFYLDRELKVSGEHPESFQLFHDTSLVLCKFKPSD